MKKKKKLGASSCMMLQDNLAYWRQENICILKDASFNRMKQDKIHARVSMLTI